jgi:arabinose-5-phosphate isomerase
MNTEKDFCTWGREVVQKELAAIAKLDSSINEQFAAACELMLQCKGRVVVVGLGKSGHIGGKIAATLASTGTPAFFVHAGEASHGDCGMITLDDVVLILSNSGKTHEVLILLPLLKHLKVPLISITGAPNSPLATGATVNLDIKFTAEAGPLDLAPTSSTTAALVLGDALAISLLRARNFSLQDFARSHPGGTLGKRLLLEVGELMHSGTTTPKVHAEATLKETLFEMTKKHLGMTTVVDDDDHLLGIFTDGDLRRAIENNIDLDSTLIADIMTAHGTSTQSHILVFELFNQMEQQKITAVPVLNDAQQVVGVIHLHDILQAGVI